MGLLASSTDAAFVHPPRATYTSKSPAEGGGVKSLEAADCDALQDRSSSDSVAGARAGAVGGGAAGVFRRSRTRARDPSRGESPAGAARFARCGASVGRGEGAGAGALLAALARVSSATSGCWRLAPFAPLVAEIGSAGGASVSARALCDSSASRMRCNFVLSSMFSFPDKQRSPMEIMKASAAAGSGKCRSGTATRCILSLYKTQIGLRSWRLAMWSRLSPSVLLQEMVEEWRLDARRFS